MHYILLSKGYFLITRFLGREANVSGKESSVIAFDRFFSFLENPNQMNFAAIYITAYIIDY